jgi:hypothetical protein
MAEKHLAFLEKRFKHLLKQAAHMQKKSKRFLKLSVI